ncbi:WSC-like protein [Alternaria alternata]|nr:WSC-like protein [Alternaria alternata]
MKTSSILILGLATNTFAFAPQQVLSSLGLAGSSYQCDNGAKPSVVCNDASDKHNCSCTCTNGIKFDQPLDPFSSATNGGGSQVAHDAECKADKDFCLEREQQLMTKITELTDSEQKHVTREQELLDQLSTYQKKTTTYLGCLTDGDNRVLGDKKFQNDPNMTVERCGTLCAGFNYFGVQWGQECYCGNTFKYATQHKPESDCSRPCTGDKNQKCGGSHRSNVYAKIN